MPAPVAARIPSPPSYTPSRAPLGASDPCAPAPQSGAHATPDPRPGTEPDTIAPSSGAVDCSDIAKAWSAFAGDDINTIKNESAPLWQRGIAAGDLASNIPVDPLALVKVPIEAASKAFVHGIATAVAHGAGASAVHAAAAAAHVGGAARASRAAEATLSDAAKDARMAIPHQGVANGTDASRTVIQRLNELGATTSPNRKGKITLAVAVAQDRNGTKITLVGSSEGTLRKEARTALKPDEVRVPGPRGSQDHAEVNIVNYAKAHNLKIIDIGASNKICVPCQNELAGLGAHYSTALRDN